MERIHDCLLDKRIELGQICLPGLSRKQDFQNRTRLRLYTEKNFWVELTFAVSLTGLLSHLGSNICKTQDHSHSDTTPLCTGHSENFQGEKLSI